MCVQRKAHTAIWIVDHSESWLAIDAQSDTDGRNGQAGAKVLRSIDRIDYPRRTTLDLRHLACGRSRLFTNESMVGKLDLERVHHETLI